MFCRANPKKCIYPPQPKNGKYEIQSNNKIFDSKFATKYTLLHYMCDDEYVLFGEAFLVCNGRKWNHEPPICASKSFVVAIKGLLYNLQIVFQRNVQPLSPISMKSHVHLKIKMLIVKNHLKVLLLTLNVKKHLKFKI